MSPGAMEWRDRNQCRTRSGLTGSRRKAVQGDGSPRRYRACEDRVESSRTAAIAA